MSLSLAMCTESIRPVVDGEGKIVRGGKWQYTNQEQVQCTQSGWRVSNSFSFSVNVLLSVATRLTLAGSH